MSATRKFTDSTFQSEVLNSDQPVLVDFWAPWCGPCRMVGPTIDELASDFEGEVKVGKLNIDENPQAPRDFNVSSIPTVLLIKQGEVLETFVGVQPKEQYTEALQRAANGQSV